LAEPPGDRATVGRTGTLVPDVRREDLALRSEEKYEVTDVSADHFSVAGTEKHSNSANLYQD